MTTPSANNFDLIRLVAALQVALHHSLVHLGVDIHGSWLLSVTSLFPGVPIFFFISGFLISKSYERNPQLYDYIPNRILRIYPGLFVCFFVSIGLVFLTGYFQSIDVPVLHLLRWTAAQLTIGQLFNPDFMRQYGVGVLNGSLWTIAVELQFYVIVPLGYMISRVWGGTKNPSNNQLIASFLLFLLINQLYAHGSGNFAELVWYKLLGVSFLPWFYMFLLGVIFQRNYLILHGWFAGKVTMLALLYFGAAFFARSQLGWGFGNTLNPIIFLAISVVTFAAAFSYTGVSDKLLRRNDMSYGVYIYHMPVVIILVYTGFVGTFIALFVSLTATVLLAFASWRWVEKPSLRFKRHPLYQHYAPVVERGHGVRTNTG